MAVTDTCSRLCKFLHLEALLFWLCISHAALLAHCNGFGMASHCAVHCTVRCTALTYLRSCAWHMPQPWQLPARVRAAAEAQLLKKARSEACSPGLPLPSAPAPPGLPPHPAAEVAAAAGGPVRLAPARRAAHDASAPSCCPAG